MARVTVEDCLEKVDNRFKLILLSSRRARQLALTAAEPLVPEENDKVTVIALREIAAGLIDDDKIRLIERQLDPEEGFHDSKANNNLINSDLTGMN